MLIVSMDGGITWGAGVGISSALFSDESVVAMSTPARLCPTEPRAVRIAHDASHVETFHQNQEHQDQEHQNQERVHHVGCGTDEEVTGPSHNAQGQSHRARLSSWFLDAPRIPRSTKVQTH